MIPTSYVAEPGSPLDTGCSLDGDGGPGMYEADAFHTAPSAGPEPERAGLALRGRVNLLNWNGSGRPDGLFPEATA